MAFAGNIVNLLRSRDEGQGFRVPGDWMRISQDARVKRALEEIHAEIINDLISRRNLSKAPRSISEIYELMDLSGDGTKDDVLFARAVYTSPWARNEFERDLRDLMSMPIWTSSDRAKFQEATALGERRNATPSRAESLNINTSRDFWAQRRRRLAGEKPDSQPQPNFDRIEGVPNTSPESPSYSFIETNDDDYRNQIGRLNPKALKALDDQLSRMINRWEDDSRPFYKRQVAQWRRAKELIAERRAVVDAEQKKLQEEAKKRFAGEAKSLKPRPNIHPRILPDLQPEGQRERWGFVLAQDPEAPGRLAVAERIENDNIQDAETAILALDAGVPLDQIPQRFWFDAIYGHMDPDRDNVKQWRRLGKNGGICKDGQVGDLLILEQLDNEGNPTGTGFVLAWEAWRAAMGKNGMRNNVGEVIGWQLANALGLPVEPARFDGIFHADGQDGAPGVAYLLPMAFNRAPEGFVEQVAYSDGDGYDPNFDPRTLDGLPDLGYPQRLAHGIYRALINAPDGHDQNVMGGLVRDQAIVVPMDLGWGGTYLWDGGFRAYLDGDMDYEYDMTSEIESLLNRLPRDEADELRAKVGRIWDEMRLRAQQIIDEGEDAFIERVVENLHLDAFPDLSDDDANDVRVMARSTAREWFNALRNNMQEMDIARDGVFDDWGLDTATNYATTPQTPAPRGPANPSLPSRGSSPQQLSPGKFADVVAGMGLNLDIKAFDSATAARRFAIGKMLGSPAYEMQQHMILRDKETGKFYVVETPKYRELRDGFWNAWNNVEDSWDDVNLEEDAPSLSTYVDIVDEVNGLSPSDVDPLEHQQINQYFKLRYDGLDYASFSEKAHEYIDSPSELSDAASRAARIASGDAAGNDPWSVVEQLEEEILFEFTSANGFRYPTDEIDVGYARAYAMSKLRADLIESLNGRNIPKPIRSAPSRSEVGARRTDRVIPGLRPEVPARDTPFTFVDVEDALPGQVPVPKPIVNSRVRDIDSAIDEFNRGVDLDSIPEEFWHAVLDDHDQQAKIGNVTPRYVKMPISNEGAIKVVEWFAQADDEGLPRMDRGIFFVKDNGQGMVGELIGWNLLGALGLNIGGARIVGREGPFDEYERNNMRWVALPHGLNYAPRGSVVSPSSNDLVGGTQVGGDDVNFNHAAIQRLAQDGGIKNRLGAFLSQFMIGLPDRHYNNVVGANFRRSDGVVEAAVAPIDVGWAGDAIYVDWDDYMFEQNVLFYDKTFFQDAKSVFESKTPEERQAFARELVQIVDEMINRQRAIILRGRAAFVDDAVRQITDEPGNGTLAMQNLALRRNEMRAKANKIFTALQEHMRRLEGGMYASLMDSIGVTDALGSRPSFPGQKGLNIRFYRTKQLNSSLKSERTKMATGVSNG